MHIRMPRYIYKYVYTHVCDTLENVTRNCIGISRHIYIHICIYIFVTHWESLKHSSQACASTPQHTLQHKLQLVLHQTMQHTHCIFVNRIPRFIPDRRVNANNVVLLISENQLYVYTHFHIYVYTHAYIYIFTYIHTYIYIYTHIHSNRRILAPNSF